MEHNMRYYQACFSSIDHRGLHVFNASSDLPPESRAEFARLQNSNLQPPTPMSANEEAALQPIAELFIGNEFVYHSRIKYDVFDIFGRRCLFTHSFIFHIEDFFCYPERVLLLDETNFSFTEEEGRPTDLDPLLMFGEAAAEEIAKIALSNLSLSEAQITALAKFILECSDPPAGIDAMRSIGEVKQLMFLLMFLSPPRNWNKKELCRKYSFTTGPSPSARPKGIYFHLQQEGVESQ